MSTVCEPFHIVAWSSEYWWLRTSQTSSSLASRELNFWILSLDQESKWACVVTNPKETNGRIRYRYLLAYKYKKLATKKRGRHKIHAWHRNIKFWKRIGSSRTPDGKKAHGHGKASITLAIKK
ncbi:hypothetical protein MTR_0214s0040 [Medicago truncatula]|uniref:Uncharacterized protein n=1 Tax=Medicago truncatula TaxID=3880 RepID=A0A072TS71_MEDTR|nr:hypothetical protein MTR_0214s0040 [Medicago truncatula]